MSYLNEAYPNAQYGMGTGKESRSIYSNTISNHIEFTTEIISVTTEDIEYPSDIIQPFWPAELEKYLIKYVFRKFLELNSLELDKHVAQGTELKVIVPKKITHIGGDLQEVVIPKEKIDKKAVEDEMNRFFGSCLEKLNSSFDSFNDYLDIKEINNPSFVSLAVSEVLTATTKVFLGAVSVYTKGLSTATNVVLGSFYNAAKRYRKLEKVNRQKEEENKEIKYIIDLRDKSRNILNECASEISEILSTKHLEQYVLEGMYDHFQQGFKFLRFVDDNLFTLGHVISFINFKGGCIRYKLYKDLDISSPTRDKYIFNSCSIAYTGHDQALTAAVNDLLINRSKLQLWKGYFKPSLDTELTAPFIPVFLLDIPILYEIDKNDLFLPNSFIYMNAKQEIKQVSKHPRTYYYPEKVALSILRDDCVLSDNYFIYTKGKFPYVAVPYKLI